MSILKRREVALAFYVVPMLLFIFVSYTGIASWISSELISWAISIWTFSYLIGIFSMFRNRAEAIIKRTEGWYYSLILFAAFFILLGLAFIPHETGYDWAILNVYTPIRLAIRLGGLINMVFLYRGAKARSLDASMILIVVSALILGKSAIGPATIPWIVPVANFFNGAPNVGVMRAITIGMAIGLLTTFIRALLGLERTYIGEAAGETGE